MAKMITRMVLIVSILTVPIQSRAETYYAFAGSCQDSIFTFDFKNEHFTGYIQLRTVGKSPQYQIVKGALKRKNTSAYVMYADTDDPIELTPTEDNSIIKGKSINQGYGVAYMKCDEALALDIIKHAIEYKK